MRVRASVLAVVVAAAAPASLTAVRPAVATVAATCEGYRVTIRGTAGRDVLRGTPGGRRDPRRSRQRPDLRPRL
jgi:hypothetical protein